jgi:hypothetical protein
MVKKNFGLCVLSLILGGLVYFGPMTNSIAGVNIDIGMPNLNISIGTPPSVVIQSPPPMAVIPGTYVYIASNVGVDILFYHGHWYRPHEGHWFSAPSYKGPWVHVAPARVPRAILELPPGYRKLPAGHQRIPYNQVKGNWERWEREKHWHRDKDWRGGWRGGHEEAGRGYEGRRGQGRRE